MVNDATDSIEIFSELTSTIPLETTQVGMSIYEITPVSPPNATIGMKYNGGSLQHTSDTVRHMRNSLLNQTDWTQLVDTQLSDSAKSVYDTYRQALRDLPAGKTFPVEVTFPTL